MFRRIHTLLAVASTVLLLGVLILWCRSRDCSDEFVVRTSWSYVGGPRVKRVVLRSTQGVALSFHVKVVPSVSAESPPWRDDVPVNLIIPPSDDEERSSLPWVTIKPTYRPTSPSVRPITDRELVGFEQQAESEYATERLVRWQSRTPQRFGGAGGGGEERNPYLTRVGIQLYHPDAYSTNSTHWPGAHHEVGAHVPYWLAAAITGAVPVSWVPVWVRRRVARRRLRNGLCPSCAYDLRESRERCPECGRRVVPGEADRARQVRFARVDGWLRDPLRRRPRATRAAAFALAVVVTVLAGTAALRARGTYDPSPDGKARELRRVLDPLLVAIAAESDHRRRAGDSAGADRLDAQLRQFRRRAACPAREVSDSPELHVVSLYRGDPPKAGPQAKAAATPGGTPPAAAPPAGPPQGTAVVEVAATDAPIVLALCGHEPVSWEVHTRPGARLQKVVLRGRDPQDVHGLPDAVPVEKYAHADPNDRLVHTSRYRPSFLRLEAELRARTALSIHTLQRRATYDGKPFVVGPANREWDTQRLLEDVRRVHLDVVRSRNARARIDLASLRFEALWRNPDPPGRPSYFGSYSLAEFDLHGPIKATFRPLPEQVRHQAYDPVTRERYGIFWNSGFVRIQPYTESGVSWPGVRIAPEGALPRFSPDSLALDERRRQFMLIGSMERSRGAASVFTYQPDTNQWSFAGPLGRNNAYTSLTFSPHDDCFYALGPTVGGFGGMAVVRINARGDAEWRIPVLEQVYISGAKQWRGPPQIVAAGPYLAILTPPLPDPLDTEAPSRPRCILIDPRTNTTLYSGPMSPHDAPVPGK